jgi:hypothetical protein
VAVSVLRSFFAREPGATPQAEQQRLLQEFAKALEPSHLVHWPSGQAPPAPGSFILVGVAVGWSLYDQELLAVLDEAIGEGRTHDDVVAAFAADALTNATDLGQFVPGLHDPLQSPYVGWWVNGQERFTGSGPSAASFVSDRYGLVLP